MRPLVAPTDYTGAQEIFQLHNGDWPVTIVLDKKGRTFLAQNTSVESYSCLWADRVIDGPLGVLVAIDTRILQIVTRVIHRHAHLSMDSIDAWDNMCNKLPSLGTASDEDAMARLVKMIEEKAIKAKGRDAFARWSQDSLIRDRWPGSALEGRIFVLDLLGSLVGITLIKQLCVEMSIDPPRPPTLKALGPTDAAAVENPSKASPKTVSHKKLKVTPQDIAKHRSLTTFFKTKSK